MDQLVDQSSIGQTIEKNKMPIIAALAVVLIAVFGSGYYKSMQKAELNKHGAIIASFEATTLKNYQDQKINEDQLLTGLTGVGQEIGKGLSYSFLAMKISDLLAAKQKNDLALKALSDISVSGNAYASYFMAIRKAALMEDLGQTDGAIKELDTLLDSPVQVFKGKLYLDLGRLHLKKGNKDQAKKNFEFVVEQMKTDTTQAEFVKMARLYLLDL
jgi:predicted negative regulator of RcsB-dependent stress response